MSVLSTRATPIVLACGSILTVLLGLVLAASRADPGDAFMVVAIAMAAAAAIALLPRVNPAVPLTAGLLLSVFSGQWQYAGVPVGPDRPILLYGIAGVLVRLLPDARRRLRLRVTWIHWILLAVVVYAVGSALFAGTLTQREPFYGLLDRLGIIGFLLFAVAPAAFRRQADRDLLLAALIALGAYLGLTALFEMTGLRSLVFPRYINDPTVGIHFERARGPFVEAGANGLALYVCLVACSIGFFRWRRGGVRVAIGAVGALSLLGIVLTLTRQVWLGAAAASLGTMMLVPQLRRALVPTVVIGLVAVFGAFAIVPGLREKVDSRTNDRLPVWDRLNSNRAAVDMIERRPLLGFGWYRFADRSTGFYRQAGTYPLTTPVTRPHNVFLGNAAELGLLGSGLWIVALLAVLGSALIGRAPPDMEAWRVGLLAVAVAWFVVANFTPLGYAFANHVLWLWAGVVWARRPVWVPARSRRPAPAGAVAVRRLIGGAASRRLS